MEQLNIISKNQFDTKCLVGMLEGLKYYIKSVVKETMEEVVSEKMCNANMDEQKLLTSDELCSRWEICKSTLYNYEVDGKITPMKVGRKKLYPLGAVLEFELENCKRPACC